MHIRVANRNMANKKGEREKILSEQTYQVIVGKEIKSGIFSPSVTDH